MSRSFGSTPLTIRPSIATVPALTPSSPATMRNRVDLPQPDGPTTTTSSPSATAQLTPCTTSRGPKDLRTPSRVTVAILRVRKPQDRGVIGVSRHRPVAGEQRYLLALRLSDQHPVD